jgi:hypothetical protein
MKACNQTTDLPLDVRNMIKHAKYLFDQLKSNTSFQVNQELTLNLCI